MSSTLQEAISGAETTDGQSRRSRLRRLIARVTGEAKLAVAEVQTEPIPEPVPVPEPQTEPEPVVEEPPPKISAYDDEGNLTELQLDHNAAVARVEKVVADVHPQDFIYHFCCTHPELTAEAGANYYFTDGGRSALKLVDLIRSFDDLNPQAVELLEFASGYGCVSRHLQKFPQLKLTACDIHEEAIRFEHDVLGVNAVLSNKTPESLTLPQSYDVVFALSFFSHMPKSSFGRWVHALYGCLKTPGYLVFTTHGQKSCSMQSITPDDIPADGFWFRAASEQHDLDTAEYGTSITTPDFVIGEVYRQTQARIVAYRQAGWWGHQDLYVLKREA